MNKTYAVDGCIPYHATWYRNRPVTGRLPWVFCNRLCKRCQHKLYFTVMGGCKGLEFEEKP